MRGQAARVRGPRRPRWAGSRRPRCAARSAVIAGAVVLAVGAGGGRWAGGDGWAAAAGAPSAGAVRGAVVDESGQAAVAGALIVLLPLHGDGPSLELKTGSDGRFARSDVTPGLYAVTAALGDRRSEVYRVRVRDRRTVEIHFVLETGRRAVPWVVADGDRGELDDLFAAGVKANQQGAYGEAVTYFALAAELYPECMACHYNAGVAYTAREQWADAERAFNDALAVQPDYAAAYYGLSDVYTKWARPGDAAAAREEVTRLTLAALAATRRQAAESVERGVRELNAGDFAQARRHFREATDLDAGLAPAYYWLGVTLTALGRPAPAVTALRRYLTQRPAGEHAADAASRIADLERAR